MKKDLEGADRRSGNIYPSGTFSLQFIKKGQTRLTEFDDQILSLYTCGMTTRDIAEAFREMSGAEVSHTLVSNVTEAVIGQVAAWQNRPLDELYLWLFTLIALLSRSSG
ncbi:MAG: hypothetical protein CSA32_00690 [Desulfobulbus propionicus]|nr:MAG: hypothetical protein CSA32_00690 [Desulfobulbus propionicus]